MQIRKSRRKLVDKDVKSDRLGLLLAAGPYCPDQSGPVLHRARRLCHFWFSTSGKGRIVVEKRFVVGQPYFLFGYYDDRSTIPKIDTFVYIGQELDVFGESDGGRNWYCFQDPESVARIGLYSPSEAIDDTEHVVVTSFSREDSEDLKDLGGLIEVLVSCNSR